MDGGCRASSLGVLINKLSQSCKAPSNRLPLPLFPSLNPPPVSAFGLSNFRRPAFQINLLPRIRAPADGGDLSDTNLEVSLAALTCLRTQGQQTSTYSPGSDAVVDVQPADRLEG